MTQRNDILTYLKSGRSLTPKDAYNFWGCFRLGARVYDLRREGYNIKSEMVEVEGGKHVARYSLKERQEALW